MDEKDKRDIARMCAEYILWGETDERDSLERYEHHPIREKLKLFIDRLRGR